MSSVPGWSGWPLILCPEAFEAGGAPASSRSRDDSWRSDPGRGGPERSALEAGRRARGRFRTANRLNPVGALTHRGASQGVLQAFGCPAASWRGVSWR